jgi:hypothetical protein
LRQAGTSGVSACWRLGLGREYAAHEVVRRLCARIKDRDRLSNLAQLRSVKAHSFATPVSSAYTGGLLTEMTWDSVRYNATTLPG